MKFIGQFIQDFIARFRNDVYLEDIDTGTIASGGNLGLDSNNKIVKADVAEAHDPVTLTGEDYLTLSGQEITVGLPGRVHIKVRNDEGSTIPAGAPLYSKGEIGGSDRIKVGIASAGNSAKMPCIGIAEAEMNTSSTKDNFAISQGVYNTNISGFTGLSVGDILYVGGVSAPYLTQNKSDITTQNNFIQNVGIVLKTNGTTCQGLLVSAIGRSNDVSNLNNDHIFLGVGNQAQPTALSNISLGSFDGFGDDEQATFGASNDLKIYHNSSLSRNIIDSDVGDLYINQNANDKDIVFRCDDGSGGTETYFLLDGSASSGNPVTIFPDNSKLAIGSSSHGISLVHDGSDSTITNAIGNLTITNFQDNGDIIFKSDDGTGSTTEYFRVDGTNEQVVFSKNLKLQDNDKLRVGDANDLEISHDSFDTYVNNFTGNLYIVNRADDKDIIFQSDDGSGGVETYFFLDGSNGLTTFPDNKKLGFGNASDLRIQHDGSNSYISQVGAGDLYIQNAVDDKDIIFQSDDGSGGVETYFELDGSLGINRSYKDLRVNDNVKIQAGTGGDMYLRHDGSDSVIVNTNGHLTIENQADDRDIKFKSDDGSGGVTTYLTIDGGLGYITVQKRMQLQDSVGLYLGTSTGDLIYHNGSNTFWTHQVGDLTIETNQDNGDIIFKSDDGSGGVAEYFRVDGGDERVVFSKEARLNDNVGLKLGSAGDLHMYHDGSNSYMRQISSGNLYIDQLVDDSDIVLRSDDGSGGLATYLQLDGSSVRTRAFKDVNFDDSVKATFGASSDLQIYHDGSNSFIVDAGTGDLLNYFSNEWKVIKYGSSETCIEATSDGSVDLYYDNSKKFETTSTGVEVTGNISLTGSVQKQIQVFPMNFVDDLGTDKHFMPFVTNTEQTVNYQEEAAMVMPADGRVVSVTVHYAQMHGSDGNITVGIETSPCGQAYTNTWDIEETETIAASVADDHHVFHFAFDNAKHFESTDKMAISIQQSTAMQNAGRFFWVTAVIEYDWSTFLGGTSAEYTTTP